MAHDPSVGAVDRKTRVAIVAHSVDAKGGEQRVLHELISRFPQELDVVVFSTELTPSLRSRVEWRRVRSPLRPAALRFVLTWIQAGVGLARAGADVVHANGALVPNRIDVATVHFCHAGYREATGSLAPRDIPPVRRVNTTIARALWLAAERWCYGKGRIRVLLPVSQGLARELERHYPGVPLRVIPIGVDTERFGRDGSARLALRTSEEVASDDVIVLFVGGDWDRKGLAAALDGVAEAIRRGAGSLRLWVVGRGDEARFTSYARAAGIDGRVRFFGYRQDTERFYAAADAFVFPSTYEAFPAVALEAAVAGLPIVATPVNGVEELIGNDEGGFRVAATGPAIGEALAAIAADEALRARLGAEARRRASGLTWDRAAERVLEVYGELLRRSR
jgi:glycosyltransferase involved in cell wall biosynthesis